MATRWTLRHVTTCICRVCTAALLVSDLFFPGMSYIRLHSRRVHPSPRKKFNESCNDIAVSRSGVQVTDWNAHSLRRGKMHPRLGRGIPFGRGLETQARMRARGATIRSLTLDLRCVPEERLSMRSPYLWATRT